MRIDIITFFKTSNENFFDLHIFPNKTNTIAMMPYLELILRIVLSIFVLIVLARLEGHKQISQMTYYDYIVGITVGSIAATLCLDQDIPIFFGLLGIFLFMSAGMLFSFIARKSIWFRRILKGNPIFLVHKGEIVFNGLKKARFDVNDLLVELRTQGYFDLSEIDYAILEPNGSVSVLTKGYARPPKSKEISIDVPDDEIKVNIIIDGKIIKGNLAAMNKDNDWLLGQLEKNNILAIDNILLATLDSKDTLDIYFKINNDNKRTVLS